MKQIKKNKLLKVLSLNSFSVGISFLLGLLSTKIISVFLGASGMALLGSFRNFSAMTKSLATLGINNSVVKLLVENKKDKEELSIIYSTFFWLFLFISIFLTVVILIFSYPISDFLFFTNIYAIPIQFFGLILPLIVINTFWIAIYNGLEMFKKMILIQIISNILIFFITAVLIFKQNIQGGLFSVAIGELLMIFLTFLFVRKDYNLFDFQLQKVISKKYFDVIKKFSAMALLSAIVGPLTLIFIRITIITEYSIQEAGIWDAINRLSGFYMLFFSTGLSMYYMPKLASLTNDNQFKVELKAYFKTFVPLFFLMILGLFLFREIIIEIAFTKAFYSIKEVLFWQLLGDFFKILTLAFGFQILVKTMVKRYILIELVFNAVYLILSFFLVKFLSVEGVLQAYFYANLTSFILVLFMFRGLLKKN